MDKHDKRDISETVITAKLDHFGLRSGPIAIGERAYGGFTSCSVFGDSVTELNLACRSALRRDDEAVCSFVGSHAPAG